MGTILSALASPGRSQTAEHTSSRGMGRDADSARNHGEFHCFKIPPSLGIITPARTEVSRGVVYKPVISETGNSRQCGANRDLVHGNLAIPYQRRIDIRFVPIFPNACLLKHATWHALRKVTKWPPHRQRVADSPQAPLSNSHRTSPRSCLRIRVRAVRLDRTGDECGWCCQSGQFFTERQQRVGVPAPKFNKGPYK